MPTHYPAGPWIRSLLFFGDGEKQWSNDIWFKATGSIPPTTNINTIAAAIDTAIATPIAGVMNSNSAYIGNTTYLNNGTFTASAETGNEISGTGTGSILPTEVSLIVRANSGVATRAGNGRIFLSGIDSTMVAESSLSVLGATNMLAVCTALMGVTTLGPVACQFAVWSRKLGVLENVLFSDPAPIVGHRRKRRPIH